MAYTKPGEKLGAGSTFALGGMAGIITVYTTMPLEYVSPIAAFCWALGLTRTERWQRDQDADAESGGAPGIQELVPLCVPDLHGGGAAKVLDGYDASAGAVSGKFPLFCACGDGLSTSVVT